MEIYNDSLTASGNTGSLSVTPTTALGVNTEGSAVVEVSHNSEWNELVKLGPNDSRLVFPMGPTIRVRDLSGASNPVTVYSAS